MSTSSKQKSNITAILKKSSILPSSEPGNHDDQALSSDRIPSVAIGLPKLQINHFLSRGNGVLIPVIPLDELPLQLHGVPQRLSWEATRGMAFLGEIRSSKAMFSISTTPASKDASVEPAEQADEGYDTGEDFIPSSETVFPTMAALQLSIQSALTEAEWEANPDADFDEDYAEHARIMEAQQHNSTFPFSIPSSPKPIHPIVALPRPAPNRTFADAKRDHVPFMPSTTSQRPLPPSGLEPDESLKEYCTYWIRTGECAYTQQGCKYKHEMPPDRSTLLKVFGTDVWPKWWVEREHEHKMRNRANTSGSGEQMSPPKYPQAMGGRRDMMTGSSWRPDVGRKPMTPVTAFSAAARARPMGRGGRPSRRASPDKPSQQPRMNGVNNQTSMANKRFETRKAAVDASKSFNRFVLPIDAILNDPFATRSASPQPAAGIDDDFTDLGSDYQPLQPTQPWKSETSSNDRPAQTNGITYTSGSARKMSFPKLFVSHSQDPVGIASAGSLSSAGGTDAENSGSSTDPAARKLQGESVSKTKHRARKHHKNDKGRQTQKEKHVENDKSKEKTTVSKQ